MQEEIKCYILMFRNDEKYPVLCKYDKEENNKLPYLASINVDNISNISMGRQIKEYIDNVLKIDCDEKNIQIEGVYTDENKKPYFHLSILLEDFNLTNNDYEWFSLNECLLSADINLVCISAVKILKQANETYEQYQENRINK